MSIIQLYFVSNLDRLMLSQQVDATLGRRLIATLRMVGALVRWKSKLTTPSTGIIENYASVRSTMKHFLEYLLTTANSVKGRIPNDTTLSDVKVS